MSEPWVILALLTVAMIVAGGGVEVIGAMIELWVTRKGPR